MTVQTRRGLPSWTPRPSRVLLLLAALLLIGAYLGLLPNVYETIQRLASRPDTADKFVDPTAGRAEALFMLFAFLFMTPLTALAAFVVVGFVIIVVMTILRPLTTRIGLPEGGLRTLMVVAILWGAYAAREAWLPEGAKLVSLLARAFVVLVP